MSDDREAILARRQRFIAWALIGGAAVNASACACLTPIPDTGPDAPMDGGVDAGAFPCLSPPRDVPEHDAGLADADLEDAGLDDAATDDDASDP